jgi:integrase
LSDTAFEILKAPKNEPRFFKKLTHYGLYKALQRAGEIAKIAYGERIEGGWVIYDLRYLAGTVMENPGVPYSAVAAVLGHERRDQTATYSHVKLETMRHGVEVLEKHCREIDGFFQNCDDSQVNAQAFRQSAA